MIMLIFDYFRNASDVIETSAWKNMSRLHPHLVSETFRAMVNQQSPTFGPARKRFKSMLN